MASNLNQAFLRAYAKDRNAAGSSAPASANPENHAAAPSHHIETQAHHFETRAPHFETHGAIPSPPVANAHASLQPGSGRDALAGPNYQPESRMVPTSHLHRSSGLGTPAFTEPSVEYSRVTHPSFEAAPTRVEVTHIRTQVPQPHTSVQPPSAARNPNSARPQVSAQPEPRTAASATSVWQRLDQAAQATNPPHYLRSADLRRESVSAVAHPSQAHLHTQATPPAPGTPGQQYSMDTAHLTAEHGSAISPFPMHEDAPSSAAFETPAAAEARRRTVADFLYAAGNIPRTHLSGSSNTRAVAQASLSASGASASSVRTSDHSLPESMMPAQAAHSMDHQAVASRPMPAPSSTRSGTSEPGHLASESMPSMQRRSRILRVDIPQSASQYDSAADTNPMLSYQNMPEEMEPAQSELEDLQDRGFTSPVASQRIDRPSFVEEPNFASELAHRSSVSSSAATSMPAMRATNSPASRASGSTTTAPQVDYGRLRTAAAISAKEEKLRHEVHKPFNPVWEVDNLQWPLVCNKLMEQRAESMAQVGAHLKAACQDGLSVLAVTSPSGGEGRTTVSCCLALLAASHGMKVAMVDLDLDNPTLCLQTNLEIENDWRDVLSGDVSLDEAAVHSINDQLTVFPLKPRAGRPALTAADRRISDLLAELSESFDLLVVDTTRIRSSGNVVTGLADSHIFDAAIVVVDRRNSDAARIEETIQTIQDTGIESIGIVDNFAS